MAEKTDSPSKREEFEHGRHDFDDGKHNTTCMICGYNREDNGGAEYESDRQQDR